MCNTWLFFINIYRSLIMQFFKAYNYVLAQVGAYCLGLDKESFQTRMEKAKKFGFQYCLEQANKIKKASERALAYQSLQMWFEVTHKGRTALPIFLDWCSSGISLISALTRCVIGMESCGVFNIASAGNFYKLMADELNSELGTEESQQAPTFVGVNAAIYLDGSSKPP